MQPLILASEEHRFLVLDQLRNYPNTKPEILLEPIPRSTAPAMTFAALQVLNGGNDPVLVVTPADQIVMDADGFTQVVAQAIELANSGHIVTLGIVPNKPETGYGYIKKTNQAGQYGESDVSQFIEKPDLVTAQSYLVDGNYLWNSGIFVIKASVWISALAKFRPDILDATKRAVMEKSVDGAFVRPSQQNFADIPSDSIDYAVIENCPGSEFSIKVIGLDVGWSDLGAWGPVWDISDQNEAGNFLRGDVLALSTKNSLVYADHRLVATIGLENVVVVETSDAVLVMHKDHGQDVKLIVNQLEAQNREEKTFHRKVSRPWGWFDTLDEGERFKVKRIQVHPKSSLSLQMHAKRAEHWVVVRGIAEVFCDGKTIVLHENESTFIPLGASHRLTNPGDNPLEIIEVQSGAYLGEDDIIRLDDSYGR